MRSLPTKSLIALLVLLSINGLAQAFTPDHYDTPDLPPACGTIQVETGHRLAYRAFAVGVQRYRWDGTAWVFVEPVATLYKDFEAATLGHVQVAHDQVRLVPADRFDRGVGVARLGDDAEAVAEIGAHTAPPDLVIVGEHYCD